MLPDPTLDANLTDLDLDQVDEEVVAVATGSGIIEFRVTHAMQHKPRGPDGVLRSALSSTERQLAAPLQAADTLAYPSQARLGVGDVARGPSSIRWRIPTPYRGH